MRRAGIALLALILPVAALAQPASLTFDGERYVQRFEQKEGDARVVEYTREGETLKNWTRLAAIRHFPKLTDPKQAAGNLARIVQQHNPAARAEVIAKNDGSEAVVDFITWTPNDDRLEFNVHRYRKVPGLPGLVAYQFAWRFRQADFADPTASVKQNRKRFVDAMLRVEWPAPFR
jgi:hypothetical protein